MADDRQWKRYRAAYAQLLRLYPKAFHDRFAVDMEQTFQDVCRERQNTGRSMLFFVVGLFVETSTGIFRERIEQSMPPRKNLIRLTLGTALILAVPLAAMSFSTEVNWSAFDFVVAGALIFGTGLTFELLVRRVETAAYRIAMGVALVSAFLLIWINLAVGLIGSEENPANALYLLVLIVGVLGGALARLRPRGMVRTLLITALAQALVPLIAMLLWKPVRAGEVGSAGLVGVLLLNSLFVILFVVAALLFRRAEGHGPDSIRGEAPR